MKRSRLGPGEKSRARGSTFAAEPRPLRRDPAKALARKTPTRNGAISPASDEQRQAVQGRACIACGQPASTYRAIDPAHLVPRSKGGCDHPLCVVPLCRTFAGGCHRAYDEDHLDLLAVVNGRWPAEVGEVRHALEHLNPVELVEQLACARTQWSDLRTAEETP